MTVDVNKQLHDDLVAIVRKWPPNIRVNVIVEQDPQTRLWHPIIVTPQTRHTWPISSEHEAIARLYATDLLAVVANAITDLGGRVTR